MNIAPPFKPEFTNLVSLLGESVKRYAERPLFGTRGDDGWHWTTYSEFGSLVDHFRSGLASLGVKRGDKVAVISQNRLEWVVGAHAVYSLGASYVPMYEAQLDKEWHYILADSGSIGVPGLQRCGRSARATARGEPAGTRAHRDVRRRRSRFVHGPSAREARRTRRLA